jgi:uncharacterized protein YegL
MEFTASLSTTDATKVFLQIRGKPLPATVDRPPVHFIAVLDHSGSMGSEHRLTNCLDSMRFLTRFLTARDKLSLVMFNDRATIAMKAVTMDSAGAGQLEHNLQKCAAYGGTNISNAIGCLKECVDASTADAAAYKTGILFLTDGHANEGIVAPQALVQMLRAKLADHPTVAVNTIGYSCNHNTELLQTMAEQNAGSYNVVNDRENVATVFGMLLGSMMSCVGSNLRINMPIETTAQPTALRTEAALDGVDTFAGDIYAETDTQILFTTREGLSNIIVRGYDVVAANDIRVEVPIEAASEAVQTQIAVFELRQDVAGLLGRLATGASGPAMQTQMQQEITTMRARCTAAGLDNPLIAMLDQQLKEAAEVLRNNNLTAETRTLLAQNSGYTQMGRGLRATVSATAETFDVHLPAARSPLVSGGSMVDQDPTGVHTTRSVAEDPFMSPAMRHISGLTATLSQACAIPARSAATGLQRQVARHLTPEEIAAAEQTRALFAPAAATVPNLLSPPPISRLQFATGLFATDSAGTTLSAMPQSAPRSPLLGSLNLTTLANPAGILYPDNLPPLVRQIAAPSRQTSNVSDDSQAALGNRMAFNSPLYVPSTPPPSIPAMPPMNLN